ncbi:cytochrome c family protein [Shimia sp.]|uniref:c-type cytochrome n=1 Tax=Shimia sp. TaxID=1954381 RepID=UPI003569F449
MAKGPVILAAAVIAGGMAAGAAAQDAARGEQVFRKCKSCHQIGAGARNRTGPVLTGVVGRQAGSYPGYRYGASMRAAGAAGLVWSEALLMDYLADPSGFLRDYLGDDGAKARMGFRLRDAQDRRDVISFVAGFGARQGAATQGVTPGAQTCVENATPHGYYFVAEAPDGTRRAGPLAPGENLCARGGAAGQRAVVSVFEDEGQLEGCSRLLPGGETETLFRYVDFDRCAWSGNS